MSKIIGLKIKEYDKPTRTIHWFKKEHLDMGFLTLFMRGLIYSKDDKVWFQTTKFGDDKDRVVFK